MVAASKILTVSYGTFSCTLEGFDEPFSMMKAIAEYFRDLASEDRYFGAEPPTPDAEMIQRLAEKEIQRRVEAKINENNVVIRQVAAEAAAPAVMPPVTEPAPAVVAVATPVAAAQPKPVVTAPEPEAPKAEAAPQPAAAVTESPVAEEVQAPSIDSLMDSPAGFAPDGEEGLEQDFDQVLTEDAGDPDDEPGGIAAKLMRIRAAVESSRTGGAAPFELYEDQAPAAEPTTSFAEDFGFELDMGSDIPELQAAEEGRAAERESAALAPEPTPAASDVDDDDDQDDDLRAAISGLDFSVEGASGPAAETTAIAPIPAESLDDDAADEQGQTFFERARARVVRMGRAVKEDAIDHAPVAAANADIDLGDDDLDPDFADGTDEQVPRLMEEARQKLEGAENRRRFSAISHLKAAVAATLADRKLQADAAGTTRENEDLPLYRADLSRVVRPQRPISRILASEPRPAPLILVSEQRVDRASPAGNAQDAIRPNRGTASLQDQAIYAAEDAASFAEFAERIGAVTLTELLEAAAAYTAQVEGHRFFSRPEILRKVEFVSSRGGVFNREDGLRSFGTLLREGKLQKVNSNQFTIAESSKFVAEARRVAN